MEEFSTPSVSTRQVGIRYGLILGLISVAYFMVLVLTGVNATDGWARWSGLIFSAALIVLAQIYFKQNGDGYMSYGQGMGISFWISVISAAISSIFFVAYLTVIDPDYAQLMKDLQMQAMEEQGLSDDQIEDAMKIASKFTTPPFLLVFGIIGGVITSMLVALPVTFFTKNENPNMPE